MKTRPGILARRIAAARRARGLTQVDLGAALGLNQRSISKYERGKAEPSHSSLRALAARLGVRVDYFFEADEGRAATMLADGSTTEAQARFLPLFPQVWAGRDRVQNRPVGRVWASGSLARADLAVQVKGDSMEPELREGDVLFVRRTTELPRGNALVVVRIGQDEMVKRVVRTPRGALLLSTNPAYQPVLSRQARITGQVLGVLRVLEGKAVVSEE